MYKMTSGDPRARNVSAHIKSQKQSFQIKYVPYIKMNKITTPHTALLGGCTARSTEKNERPPRGLGGRRRQERFRKAALLRRIHV